MRFGSIISPLNVSEISHAGGGGKHRAEHGGCNVDELVNDGRFRAEDVFPRLRAVMRPAENDVIGKRSDRESAFDIEHDLIDLPHTADTEGSEHREDRKDNGENFADRLHALFCRRDRPADNTSRRRCI